MLNCVLNRKLHQVYVSRYDFNVKSELKLFLVKSQLKLLKLARFHEQIYFQKPKKNWVNPLVPMEGGSINSEFDQEVSKA